MSPSHGTFSSADFYVSGRDHEQYAKPDDLIPAKKIVILCTLIIMNPTLGSELLGE